MRQTLTGVVIRAGRYSWVRPLVALAIVGAVMLSLGCESSTATVAVGSQAPDFTLVTLDGKQAKLSDFRGKVVVLNVWATWCGFCRVEMPDLEAAYQQYRDQGVVVLGVNAQEDAAAVSQYVEEEAVSFPILLDADGVVSRIYRVRALPTTFFIDGDGIIRANRVGQMSAQMIQDGVRVASQGAIK